MQNLKTNTLATGILVAAILSFWFGDSLQKRADIMWWNVGLSVLFAFIGAFDFHNIVRIMWYGRLWRCALTTAITYDPAGSPLIQQLYDAISNSAKLGGQGKIEWVIHKLEISGYNLRVRLFLLVLVWITVFSFMLFVVVPQGTISAIATWLRNLISWVLGGGKVVCGRP
jgi:hypothetical protein